MGCKGAGFLLGGCVERNFLWFDSLLAEVFLRGMALMDETVGSGD